MSEEKTNVIQVTNISHNVSGDQIKHFLEYIGRVREVRIYPDGENVEANQTKVAYARFDSCEHVEVALHLTNTVMVDRALIVLPYPDENIPDETKALRVAAPVSTVAGMLPPTKEWPSNVVNMVCGTGTGQTIQTLDAKLVELGLPQYPPLPAKTDPSKIEEIRRTIYVSNLDPTVNAEQLVQFFSQAGEVMFVRMAGDENLPSRNAYVEFTNQRSVPTALAYNGVQLSGRHLRVTHSLNAITSKPQTKGQEQLSKEIDEAMKKYKDVEHLIHAAAGANTRGSSKRGRSRSRSREKRRHKSKERRRSRERRRSPSPRKSSRRSSRPSSQKEGEKTSSLSTKDRKRRSRSQSRSRDRKRSRSRDRSRRSRSRDRKRSRSPGKKRDRSRDRRRRSRSKDRRRSRSRDRRNRRRSSSKDKERKHKREDKSKEESKEADGVKVKRDYDAEEKDMEDTGGNKAENGKTDDKHANDEANNHVNGENGDNSQSSDSDSNHEKEGDEDDTVLKNRSANPMAELEKKLVDDDSQDSVDMDTADDTN